MTNHDRPLSPHLSVYRWPVTMVTSILHRATGVGMAVGFIVLVAWLFDAASGPDVYDAFLSLATSTVGKLLLIAWSWAFFYHLCNGIRHLVWDSGRGFEKSQANASAWIVIVGSVVLTAGFWGIAL
ncbi:MAG: succinate dehydrogenase, cytochrome b556 subunit [Woeseiaceae bacterium]|nr:succinate dehydrogenase, cytochrome b556 subunit [Woeseiaceae bacterium]